MPETPFETYRRLAAKPDAELSRKERVWLDANSFAHYLRIKFRENGFARKILPPGVTADDLSADVWTDKPIKIYER